MKKNGEYQIWSDSVKFNIAKNWDKAAQVYTQDCQQNIGQKPQITDPKYCVEGFPVKKYFIKP